MTRRKKAEKQLGRSSKADLIRYDAIPKGGIIHQSFPPISYQQWILLMLVRLLE
jgi:hypothetical protein